MDREATLREIADSKLRLLLAHNRLLKCADATVVDTALFYNAANRKSPP